MTKISKWIFWGFVLIAGFFLFAEHRAHLYGWLPFIFLALCPLMHLFHGHGDHGKKSGKNSLRNHLNH